MQEPVTATISPRELEIAINRPIETDWKALAGDTTFLLAEILLRQAESQRLPF